MRLLDSGRRSTVRGLRAGVIKILLSVALTALAAILGARQLAFSSAHIIFGAGIASSARADSPASPSVLRPFDGAISQCDVLVVGGTPSGVAAALAAARRGSRVVLVEERSHLGGDIVDAMLNMFDVPARPGEASPVHGIFAEFFDQLGVAFDIDLARHILEDTVANEPNLRAYVGTRVVRISKDGDRVSGVVLHAINERAPQQPAPGDGADRERELKVCAVVDATNDASFAAGAGAGYSLGRERVHPDKAMQSAGLLFSVSGVDWNAVRYYVRRRRLMRAKTQVAQEFAPDAAPTTSREVKKAARDTPDKPVWLRLGGAHGDYAWERGDIVAGYQPRGPRILFLSINFGRQSDGTVVLNTLNIVGVNGLDNASKERAYREAAAELPHFLAYLRRVMPGFKSARLAHIAPELYIRETRHIYGYYVLSVADIRAERQFPDRIALASYPLDLHPYGKDHINPFGPRRYYYTLPLRSLVPRTVDGVFVASRSLSATYTAAGSARVIPITMAAGEAAGAAAWLCARHNVSPHDMVREPAWISQLQDSLREWGADIGDEYPQRMPQLAEHGSD
jgi:FAD dependent oxidoreductase